MVRHISPDNIDIGKYSQHRNNSPRFETLEFAYKVQRKCGKNSKRQILSVCNRFWIGSADEAFK